MYLFILKSPPVLICHSSRGCLHPLRETMPLCTLAIIGLFSKGYSVAKKKHFDKEERKNEPFSVSCFVSGHKIPADHWYKNNDEGTRICGNLGHWIDLAIHFFFWRDHLPSSLDIKITYSDSEDPSDNIAIGISTSMGDIVTANAYFSQRAF